MTEQEIFTTVVRHLLNQGKRSMNAAGVCRHRGPDGLKCAVGVLIPDDLYRREMEVGVGPFLLSFPELDFLRPHATLLRDLQVCHDAIAPDLWREHLQIIARQYRLEMPG